MEQLFCGPATKPEAAHRKPGGMLHDLSSPFCRFAASHDPGLIPAFEECSRIISSGGKDRLLVATSTQTKRRLGAACDGNGLAH